MSYFGIDIASQDHVVAGVDEHGAPFLKPTSFTEDAAGYAKLFELLGEPRGALVAMEATGHYWRNLFAALVTRGFAVALLNPLRTRRFAQEDLERTKTDAVDALQIARFAAQKRPPATPISDSAQDELREMVRLRDRFVQDFTDRVRDLHRLVDLCFPEFTRSVRSLDSELASAILHEYPTARAFHSVSAKRLAKLCYDGRHKVGLELSCALIEAAKTSVGAHHGEAYRLQIRYACEDLDLLRRRLRDIERDIERKLGEHEVGTLLTSIDGIGPQTAARLIAELGDPARFKSAKALAAYVGVVPGLKNSGKSRGSRAGLSGLGHARLRAALWMPTLTAVRRNPWLCNYYQRLRASGKLPKIALVAAMHKLLFAVYAVAKNRRPFEPRIQAPEAQA
jgi:transposase